MNDDPESHDGSPGEAGSPRKAPRTRKTLRWALVALVGLAALVTGGTWVYVNVIREPAPERLSLDEGEPAQDSTASAAPVADVAGSWEAADASEVGYRVNEVIFGQRSEGVGRTNQVTGVLTITGTAVEKADFDADMATLESDEAKRDRSVREDILETATFPTATFALTEPIELGSIPPEGKQISAKATGDLTLRGSKREVTFDLEARRTGDKIEVSGEIPIVFADWDVPNPSRGPVTTEDHGLLEFRLGFTKKG